ncbi:MAG: DUF4430 domain-containing protein [Defluviitaleaceae bacterium]|nr:DUF4430 domain-containing protein [Defluviitaleaceae bacterium]
MKKIFSAIFLLILIAFAGCGGDSEAGGAQGETEFIFRATDREGNTTSWDISTSETTIGAALLEHGLIEGEESAFGLMVTVVNGIVADFSTDGSWWAFLIDGEMSPTGVDSTQVEAGRVYEFVFTEG